MRLMLFENVLKVRHYFLKNVFSREQFWKCLLWGSNCKYLFFEAAISKMSFWKIYREASNFQNSFFIVWKSNFENLFSEGVILKKYIFLSEQFLKYIFWEIYFFEGQILNTYFLKCNFWDSSLENVFKKN